MGFYIIQGILGDRVIYSDDHDCELTAIKCAKRLLADRTFEGDSARVLTIDGEPVWEGCCS